MLWVCFLVILLLYILYSNSVLVYRFYRPSCGYCRASQDDWELFKMKGYTNLVFGKDINLDDCPESDMHLANRLQVNSVPTIITINDDGSANVYSGNRKAESILSWAKMQ